MNLREYLQKKVQKAPLLTQEEEKKLAAHLATFKKSREKYKERVKLFEKELDKIVDGFGLQFLLDQFEEPTYNHVDSLLYPLDILTKSTMFRPKNEVLDLALSTCLSLYAQSTIVVLDEGERRVVKSLSSNPYTDFIVKKSTVFLRGEDVVAMEGVAMPTGFYLSFRPRLSGVLLSVAEKVGRLMNWSKNGFGLFYQEMYQGAECFSDTPKIGAKIISSTLETLTDIDFEYMKKLDQVGSFVDYHKIELDRPELSILALSDLLDEVKDDDPKILKAMIERVVLQATDDEWWNAVSVEDNTVNEQIDLLCNHGSLLSYTEIEKILLYCMQYQELAQRLFDDIAWQADYCAKMTEFQSEMSIELMQSFVTLLHVSGNADMVQYLMDLADDRLAIAQVLYRQDKGGALQGVTKKEAVRLSELRSNLVARNAKSEEIESKVRSMLIAMMDEDVEIPNIGESNVLVGKIIEAITMTANDEDVMAEAAREIID